MGLYRASYHTKNMLAIYMVSLTFRLTAPSNFRTLFISVREVDKLTVYQSTDFRRDETFELNN